MVNSEKMWSTLKEEIFSLAKDIFRDYVTEAIADGEGFLAKIKPKLNDWHSAYLDGKISPEELTALIGGEKDLAEMKLLKRSGLAKVQIDKFVNGLLDRTINTFLK